jgi:pimeloyl-ACP methyl ester carboxylesterase
MLVEGADGVELHVEVHGPDEAPAVLLLHGFPDSARLWRHQVPVLVEQGYRVLAPDLRGFGRSGRPDAVEAYSLLVAAGDVAAILDAAGVQHADVVGHDFGAALAWVVATFLPDRVNRLVALSVGHPAAFRLDEVGQATASWYMLLFANEGIAEEWLTMRDWANFRAWAGHPDADAIVEHFERTGGLRAALNWYRANVPPSSWVAPPPELPPVPAATMGVWSSGDVALLEAQMQRSGAHVSGPWRYERLDGAGHWMQLERPDAVNALLVDFLGPAGDRRSG